MIEEKIINEVIRLFLANGVEFTLNDVAKNLAISKKTIYKYFKDKEDLLLQAVDTLFKSVHEEQTKIFNDYSLDEVSRLKKLMLAMPKDITSIDVSFLSDLKNKFKIVYDRVIFYLESDWDETFALIDICKSKGLIKNIDNEIIKLMFLSSSEKLMDIKKSNLDYEKLQEEAVDIIIRGIQNA